MSQSPPSTPARPHALSRAAARLLLGLTIGSGSLALLALLGLAGGCKTPPPPKVEAKAQPLPNGSFKVAWTGEVDAAKYGAPDRIFLRDDLVLVYTAQNVVYALSTSGSLRFYSDDVVGRNDRLWPPAVLDAKGRLGANIARVLVFPSNTTYVLLNEQGQRVQSVDVSQGSYAQAITSPTSSADGLCYVGLADQFGGRVVTVDPTKEVAPVINPAQVRGPVISRPLAYGNTIFAADDTGTVTAITPDRKLAWAQTFTANGPIRADLTADNFGLYVPGTDGSLYVLDRNTGRLKWQYFAQVPLYRPAVVGEKNVYLPVADAGVVALSKTQGDTVSRKPLWTVADAQDILSQDAQNLYLLGKDGHLIAVDKETGEEKFRSQYNNLTLFAQNDKGARIFAADASGRVVAIDPVLGRGEIGRLARAR